jgi:DNA-binding NtrC family response regulator
MSSQDSSAVVLLLEDDEDAAEAFAVLLGDWGYRCVRGPSLAPAAERLGGRLDAVAAIISDFHLADGETGPEAVRAAASLGARAPVLLMTSTLRGMARRRVEAGGHRIMEKPADPRRIRAWLDLNLAAP